jgi:cellulose synthase/poly-beta-1,6-N-acetylglucosamine synthase-like glycosyltransferase
MAILVTALETLFYATIGIVITAYTIGLVLLRMGSQKPRSLVSNRPLPTVSVIIPTYNEASVIRQKLENVAQLDYPRDKLEVMVVDSASTDQTGDIVNRFAEEHRRDLNLVLVKQPFRRGKSEAINEALRRTRSEVMVLTDADVTFSPGSVQKLVRDLDGSEIGAVSGVEVPVGTGSLLTGIEADYRRVYTAIRMAEAQTDTPFMCESELSAYRRELIEPLRQGVVCDDLELTINVRSKGFKALYSSDVSFLENEAGNLGPKLQHKLRRGMNNQHALLQNSRVLFNSDLGKYGRLIFPFEFFVHILSPILLTASGILFVGLLVLSPLSALIALVATAAFSVPALVVTHSLIVKYRDSAVKNVRGTASWLLGAAAFLGFQFVLMLGLVKLAFKGPETNWQQVPGTRVPVAIEVSR